jgi:CRP-like cAMP-binding protein
MQALDVLEKSPLFAGVSRSALKEMAGKFVMESWPKNRQIAGPVDTARRFRILARGRVKITRSNAQDARELTLWLLGPGDGFDLVSLLDGERHAVSAWSLDEVQTLCIPLPVLQGWIERSPALRLAVHRYLARQLRTLTDLAADLALHDTMTRMAQLLLRHFDESADAKAPKVNLIGDLPQGEIASLIGSVRIVVSRLLAELKREAIVDLRGGALRVLDLKRLLRRAEAHADHSARRPRRPKTARE